MLAWRCEDSGMFAVSVISGSVAFAGDNAGSHVWC